MICTTGAFWKANYEWFAHAPLATTISECARRLGVPMSDDQATDLADRIDVAAMTPDELAHVRDLDAAVWGQRWKLLYAIADEWVAMLGDAINTDMHDPLQWPEPASVIMMVFFSFVGGAAVYRANAQIAVEFPGLDLQSEHPLGL